MKKLIMAAPFVLVALAMIAHSQTSSFTRNLALYASNNVIANATNFFEANKAALNRSVSNRPILSVNGQGPVTSIVDTATATWFVSGGQASVTASGAGSIGAGLLVCSADNTVHALGVYQLGTNYLLSMVKVTNEALPSTPASIPLVSGDLSVHQLYVQKLGTNYLIGLTQ